MSAAREGKGGSSCGRAATRRATRAIFFTARPPSQLDFLRFPLGDLPKDEVRRLATEGGLIVADKPDSQDICFVPDGDYAALVKKLRPETAAPGDIVACRRSRARPAPRRGSFHRSASDAGSMSAGRPSRSMSFASNRRSGALSSARARALAVAADQIGGVNWLGEGQVRIEAKVRSLARPVPATWDGEYGALRSPGIWRRAGTVGGLLRWRAGAWRRNDHGDRGSHPGRRLNREASFDHPDALSAEQNPVDRATRTPSCRRGDWPETPTSATCPSARPRTASAHNAPIR